jgi:hypothetical protein
MWSACTTPDGDGKTPSEAVEEGEEAPDSDSSCSASFTLGFPDGTTATLDYCERFSLEATYEFDPDVPPEVRAPVVVFSAVEDEQFECRIGIRVPDACGAGYYMLDGASAGVDVVTYDCTGVDDEYEGSFSSSGYLRVDTIHAGDVAGNLTGEPLSTALAGYLSVTTESGITVTGDFSIAQDVVADDAEDSACASSDGDEDDDGFIDYRLDGDDCDDTFAQTYPGAAAMEPTLCARDEDEDGYGDMDPQAPVEAGTDCNDGTNREYPGAVEEASESECMRDGDGDGYGDADVRGTNYDAGTDCDDADRSMNPADGDSDGYSTCAGDCNDSQAAVSPDEEEVCDNSLDDNCDGRVNEYCDYREATSSYGYYNSSSTRVCSYRISPATRQSTGACTRCVFHFYTYDTERTDGSSSTCRGNFATEVSVNEVDRKVYFDTYLPGGRVEFYGDITLWEQSETGVFIDWNADLDRYSGDNYELRGDLFLVGDW